MWIKSVDTILWHRHMSKLHVLSCSLFTKDLGGGVTTCHQYLVCYPLSLWPGPPPPAFCILGVIEGGGGKGWIWGYLPTLSWTASGLIQEALLPLQRTMISNFHILSVTSLINGIVATATVTLIISTSSSSIQWGGTCKLALWIWFRSL